MIYGLLVVKDEAERYLDSCLTHALRFLDGIFVYDDRSTDGTLALVKDHGCAFRRRPLGVPSFEVSEGKFRQAAWEAFEQEMTPQPEDKILALDADEFLIAEGLVKPTLQAVVDSLNSDEVSVQIPIVEIFDVSKQRGLLIDPQMRIDGFWGSISHPRLFRYQPNGHFQDVVVASGSWPDYVGRNEMVPTKDLEILHMGYADSGDAIAKHARYSGRPGHSSQHVESILQPKTLVPWVGCLPSIWRGRL